MDGQVPLYVGFDTDVKWVAGLGEMVEVQVEEGQVQELQVGEVQVGEEKAVVQLVEAVQDKGE